MLLISCVAMATPGHIQSKKRKLSPCPFHLTHCCLFDVTQRPSPPDTDPHKTQSNWSGTEKKGKKGGEGKKGMIYGMME